MLVSLHRIDMNFGYSRLKVFLLATGTEEDCFHVDLFDYFPEQSASIILSLLTEDTHRYIPMYTHTHTPAYPERTYEPIYHSGLFQINQNESTLQISTYFRRNPILGFPVIVKRI